MHQNIRSFGRALSLNISPLCDAATEKQTSGWQRSEVLQELDKEDSYACSDVKKHGDKTVHSGLSWFNIHLTPDNILYLLSVVKVISPLSPF